jgi:G:T-mismatch repair DNA endonuclease (very short patch repair protein)
MKNFFKERFITKSNLINTYRLKKNIQNEECQDLYLEILEYSKDFSILPKLNHIGFLAKLWYFELLNPICAECSKPVDFSNGSLNTFCSVKCRNQNEKLKMVSKETSLKKYGVEHHSKTKDFREKIKRISPFKNKEKIKQAIFDKYGVDNVSKLPEIKAKSTKTFIENNRRVDLNKEEFLKFKHNDSLDLLGLANKFSWSTVSLTQPRKYARLFNIEYTNTISNYELEIVNFIKSIYSGEIIIHDRKILSGLELDIYLPEYKLAIEFNGSYWHSYNSIDKFNISRKQSDKTFNKNRHIEKTELCEHNGIHLLHIFEFSWLHKKDIWKSIIRNKLKKNTSVYARKCEIVLLDIKTEKKFLIENHLQGYSGSSIKLGLKYNDEIISVMTFGKPRFNKKYNFELIRFCNKINISVVGGASKLFKYFIKNYFQNNSRIISYGNRIFSSFPNIYEKLGFKYLYKTQPNFFYVKNNDVYNRQKFQKHKLKELKNFRISDISKTSHEILNENGYRIIWDSGNTVYEFTKEN